MIKAFMYLPAGLLLIIAGNNDMMNFGFLLIMMGMAEGLQALYDFVVE